MAKSKKNTAKGRTTKARKTIPAEVPPGATRKAWDRPTDPGGGPPGSGAGPRHAAGDPGSDIEAYTQEESNQGIIPPEEEKDALEKGPPYAGPSGGAVGGAPAELRSTGGRTGHGIAPGGVHRGDSTVGANPDSGNE